MPIKMRKPYKAPKFKNLKNLEICYSERCGYSVLVNGETVLECLAADEIEVLTVKEIMEIVELHGEFSEKGGYVNG